MAPLRSASHAIVSGTGTVSGEIKGIIENAAHNTGTQALYRTARSPRRACCAGGTATMPSNGEVEGPPRSTHRAPRAHTVFPRPRRVTSHRSRTPPTIVRAHARRRHQCPHEPRRARERIPVPHRTPTTAGSKRNVSSPPNQNTTQYRSCGSACWGIHAQSHVRMTAREIASTTPRRTLMCALTVKLRGRPEAPDWSHGCILSSRTRGDTSDSHGPLQRLLGVIPVQACVGPFLRF